MEFRIITTSKHGIEFFLVVVLICETVYKYTTTMSRESAVNWAVSQGAKRP